MARGPTGRRRGYDPLKRTDEWKKKGPIGPRTPITKSGPSQDDRDRWHWILTPGTGSFDRDSPDYGATVKQFKESFKVGTEKPGEEVWFKERPKQAYRRELREAFWEMGLMWREVCGKGRRYGMSVDAILDSIAHLRIAGFHTGMIAKDDADAQMFKSMALETFNQIPTWALEMMGWKVLRNDGTQVRIQHGTHRQSFFVVITANKGGLGRGWGLHHLKATEPPHYTDRAKSEYRNVAATVGEFPGNCESMESTAKGFDRLFYSTWEEADWAPEGLQFPGEPHAVGNSDSSFVRIFVGAYEHPDAYRPFTDDGARTRLRESIGKSSKFGNDYERDIFENHILPFQRRLPEIVDRYGCRECWRFEIEDGEDAAYERALQQINYFRRLQVDKCKGDIGHRKQEFPFTPEEMFQSTGSAFLDLDKIRAWLPVARLDMEKNTRRGRFIEGRDSVFWKTDHQGPWLLREEPVPGKAYTYGCDTAGGKKKHADGKTEADWPYICVGDVETGFVMAEMRFHMKSSLVAAEIAKASLFFGCAPGLVERTPTGEAGATLAALEKLDDVCDWSPMECAMKTAKTVWSDQGQVIERVVGIETRKGTKRPRYDTGLDFFDDEVGMPVAGQRCLLTWHQLSEMNYLENDDGKIEASQGHDDAWDGLTIMLTARALLIADPGQQRFVPTVAASTEEDEILADYFSSVVLDDQQGDFVPGMGGGW